MRLDIFQIHIQKSKDRAGGRTIRCGQDLSAEKAVISPVDQAVAIQEQKCFARQIITSLSK